MTQLFYNTFYINVLLLKQSVFTVTSIIVIIMVTITFTIIIVSDLIINTIIITV